MISGPWNWTKAREKAAELLAEDSLSDEKIAEACGVTRVTLHFWKQREEFTNRIAQHVQAFREEIRAEGIANKQNRIDALNDRWHRMMTVIDERAEAEENQDAPGGSTGLLVRDYKMVGFGPQARFVETFAVDTGLLREMRETEKQAAQELGHWTEKRDITSAGKAVMPATFTITIDRRDADDLGDDDENSV